MILLPTCKELGQEAQGYPNPDQFQTLTSMKATIMEPTITTLAFRVAQSNREKDRPPFSVNLSMSGEAAQGKPVSVGYHSSHHENVLLKWFLGCGSAADPAHLGEPGLLRGASSVTAVPSHSSAPQSGQALSSTLSGRVCAAKPRRGSAALSPGTPFAATRSRDPTAPGAGQRPTAA